MLTPYDWQEGVAQRAQYVSARLESGSPVMALSLDEGILMFTVRRQARKIYEIYDRLMYSAIGQQSDVESMRVAAIDFAHQEGFQGSEADVTIQRVVSALSQPLKKAFGDPNTAPFVVRSVFAHVGDTVDEDGLYILDFDGDFSVRKGFAYLAGTGDQGEMLRDDLRKLHQKGPKVATAIAQLKPMWAAAMAGESGKGFDELTVDLTTEIALLDRKPSGETRFRLLEG